MFVNVPQPFNRIYCALIYKISYSHYHDDKVDL